MADFRTLKRPRHSDNPQPNKRARSSNNPNDLRAFEIHYHGRAAPWFNFDRQQAFELFGIDKGFQCTVGEAYTRVHSSKYVHEQSEILHHIRSEAIHFIQRKRRSPEINEAFQVNFTLLALCLGYRIYEVCDRKITFCTLLEVQHHKSPSCLQVTYMIDHQLHQTSDCVQRTEVVNFRTLRSNSGLQLLLGGLPFEEAPTDWLLNPDFLTYDHARPWFKSQPRYGPRNGNDGSRECRPPAYEF